MARPSVMVVLMYAFEMQNGLSNGSIGGVLAWAVNVGTP